MKKGKAVKKQISNIQLLNKLKNKFTKKVQLKKIEKKEIEQNLVSYFQSIMKKEFNFKLINLEELAGLGIGANESNLMITLLLEKIISKYAEASIKSLFYLMGLAEKKLEDLDEYLLAGHDLYIDLLQEFKSRTAGTLIQYMSALCEEFLKKFYTIKTGKPLDAFLTLAPLIKEILQFSPYKNNRSSMSELEPWQVPLIWTYELRNLFMHNVLSLTQNTFEFLYYIITSGILLIPFILKDYYKDWFIQCPKCKNPLFTKFKRPGEQFKCLFCDEVISKTATDTNK